MLEGRNRHDASLVFVYAVQKQSENGSAPATRSPQAARLQGTLQNPLVSS